MRIRFWGFSVSSTFAEAFLCHGLVIFGQQAIYRILVMSSTCQLERTGRGSDSDACWPKEATEPSFLKTAKKPQFMTLWVLFPGPDLFCRQKTSYLSNIDRIPTLRAPQR